MAIQLSVSVRNQRLDQIEVAIGVSAVLKIWTGAVPANCAAADSGTNLALVNLPSDWMAGASGGSKAKLGTWQTAAAANSGVAGYFRIYDVGGATCYMQGTVGTAGTDMVVDSATFNAGLPFTVNSFTWTDGNA